VVGASVAAGFGAKAIFIRSLRSDNERLPHTGVLQYDTKITQILVAAISNSNADLLEHMLTLGQPVRLNLALDCGTQGEYAGANVIGEITGSEHPEVVIVIGGHLDSWDPGTGAIDDGERGNQDGRSTADRTVTVTPETHPLCGRIRQR
jgi:Zn-dependent M28 family amino/carboxypeptidase